MRLLSLHCDYLKFKATKKAIKEPEELSEEMKQEILIKELLGVFVAIEKTDEGDITRVIESLVSNILDLNDKVKAERIVIYPYAHLSSNLSNPTFAQKILQGAEELLRKKNVEVFRAPFGYYKSFELKCKGHPLSELSREVKFGSEDNPHEVVLNKILNDGEYDSKKLLASISKSKLDTSKLKENDHRIIGKNLDLWSFNEVAPGMVFWHNSGLIIYNELIKYWREEHVKNNYLEIKTPQIMDSKLWKVSGHWEKYKDNNFITTYEDRPFLIKPMNCPGGMLVYKNSPKSYKDLPLRVGELGLVHRTELSGVLAGLFRLIQFTQDDAHIFCANEKQVEDEISSLINLINSFYKKMNIEFHHVELSTRPEKRIGSDETWDMAEGILEKVLKNLNMKYAVNKGDGAFYGPKIDFHVKDSLDRTWQLSTIQLDFALPDRFELEYTDNDGKNQRPIMLHRVIYGAIERFIAILTEHLNGNFPIWLAPIQVKVLSFTDRNEKAAQKVLDKLKAEGIRAEADFSSSTMGDKVRNASLLKIPYILTIGDKEEENETLAVKLRGQDKPKFGIKLKDFLEDIKEKILKRE
jgi:threonyl-tRNA synthetase